MFLNIKEAACAMNGEYNGKGESIIAGMFTDSREAFEGGLFFALRGERVDGHRFVPELNEKGFPCVVADAKYHTGENILVPDVERALGDLARWWREKYVSRTKVIAVTGSVGKTTTKDMLGRVFSAEFNTFVPQGNKNSTVGLPMSVAKLTPAHEYAVFELGSSRFGEISYLSGIVHPSLSVITCIGSSHLEYFLTRENIRKEKYGILDGETPGGYLILDGDSDADFAMRVKIKDHKPVYCGFSDRCDFVLNIENSRETSTEFTVKYRHQKQAIKLYVPGDHAAKDAAYAFAAGVLCGIDPETAATAVGQYSPYGDRQRIYDVNGIKVIADCYNAAPESMVAAFQVLKEQKSSTRRIAVLGDMLELGKNSDRMHEDVARLVGDAADFVVYIGYFARIFADACVGKRVICFDIDQKHEAAAYLKENVIPGDAVLFKASRGVGLETVIKEAGL